MRNLLLIFAALSLIGCSNAAQTNVVNQTTQTTNANQTVQTPNNSTIVSSHSNSPTANPNQSSNASMQGGSPMAKPVDVKEMTAEIEKAESRFKKNPKDEKAKSELAKAYFVRATALTGAAQYRQALGDYRKGLKLDPNDEAAQKMHGEIIRIFQSMGRELPKEGEEPPPLPMNKN